MNLLICCFVGAMPYASSPDWESATGYYSTGGGLADIDGDGNFDLVVGEGNDMAQQPNHVYFGNGISFSTNPGWSSDDLLYSGHLAIGDIEGDGDVDLVISNFRGYGWTQEHSTLYLNTGTGLNTSPDWLSDSAHSFSCALGDLNGDGRPELCFARGEPYHNIAERSVIFLNTGSGYGSTPWWQSDTGYALDAAFADVNADGWLDLVLAGEYMPVMLFLNNHGVLSSTPDWQSQEDYMVIQCALGDLDGDGYPELAIAENGQLGSRSRVWVFKNNGGTFEDYPSWDSQDSKQYYSTVAFGDPDGDGDLDLAAGGWWEEAVIFENVAGVLQTPPAWSWITSPSNGLVCEKVLFGNVDNDGLVSQSYQKTISGRANCVQLPTMPVAGVDRVIINGDTLGLTSYFASLEEGFVCFDTSYTTPGQNTVIVEYTAVEKQDLIITNWEDYRGNFLFRWDNSDVAELETGPVVSVRPNPFSGQTTLQGQFESARLFDASGRFLKTVGQGLFGKELEPGVYFLQVGGQRLKIVKTR